MQYEYTPKVPGKRGLIAQHFDSLIELDAARVPDKWGRQYASNVLDRHKNDHRCEEWWGFGVKSGGWARARELILEGNPEGRIRGSMFLDRLDFPPTTMRVARRQRRRGDDGDEVDMQRVWSGSLDTAWEYMVREGGTQTLQNNSVIVAIDTGILASQHSDELFWNAATGCAVVDALCRSGRNVEVIAVACADNYAGTHWLTSVTMKPATAPLNLDLLFSMTLGGFHRGYMFKSRHLRPEHSPPGGMGVSVHANLRSPFWPSNWPVVYIKGNITEVGARMHIAHLVQKFETNSLSADEFN